VFRKAAPPRRTVIVPPPPPRPAAPRARVNARHMLGGAAALAGLALALATANGLLSPAMAAETVFGDPDAGTRHTPPMPFERPGESFPGSAYYYLADSAPPLDPSAHWDSDPTPPPAAPIATDAHPIAIANPADRARALACMTAAIYYEAATEPDDGQRAVAQVILNRLAHPSFPKTVCGVVYQGSERASGCQFTFSCDGSMARAPMRFFWDRAMAVARAALAGAVYAPVGLATHYHTFAVHPVWADSLDFLGQIGAHRFYRMEGPAGAPTAFHFAYLGGEPLPGPHPRLATPGPDSSPDPLAVERAYAEALRAPAIVPAIAAPAPAYTGDVLSHGGDAAFRASNLPENRAIRPEYQHSGAWIGDPQ